MSRDALPEVIETARLRLRPFGFDDVDDVMAYATTEAWARFLPVPRPYTRRHAEEFIARQVLEDRKNNPCWAVTHEGTVIGGIDVQFSFKHRRGTIGYSIAPDRWNRGFATEAASAVVDAAFETHADLRRMDANADARNEASHRVLAKIGMTREGRLRSRRVLHDEPEDVVWFGVLRAEWEREAGG